MKGIGKKEKKPLLILPENNAKQRAVSNRQQSLKSYRNRNHISSWFPACGCENSLTELLFSCACPDAAASTWNGRKIRKSSWILFEAWRQWEDDARKHQPRGRSGGEIKIFGNDEETVKSRERENAWTKSVCLSRRAITSTQDKTYESLS